MDASNITGYTTALNGLSAKQAELVLSTKGLSTAQQQAILKELSLASVTGKLTTAQMTELLTTKSRSKADAEALLLNAGLITSETAEATATNVVTAAKLKELVQTKTLTQAEVDLIAAKAGVTLANQKESASFLTSIGTKIKGLGSGLKSAGTGVLALAKAHPVIAGITTALTIGTVAVGIYKKKQEEAAQAIKEAYEEAKTTIDEINSSFKNTKSSTEEIAEEYAELAQGVNLLTNANKKLSTENYERFLELSNQLSELYPTLTTNFDENGNAILALSGDVDTIVGSLYNLLSVQKQLANQEILDNMDGLFDGYIANREPLNKELTKKRTALETYKTEAENAYRVVEQYGTKQFFDANDTQNATKYLQALQTLGIFGGIGYTYDKYGTVIGQTILADIKEIEELPAIIGTKYKKLLDEKEYTEAQLNSVDSTFSSYLETWLEEEYVYENLSDTGLKLAMQEALFNFDWNDLPKNLENWDKVSEYLRQHILFSINNIDDTEVSKALSDIYTGNLTSGEMLDAITKAQSYFGESHPISLSLELKVEDIEPLVNNVKDKLKGTEFDDRVGELSLGDLQIAADLEVPDDSIQSWDDLLERIEEAKKQASSSTLSLSESQSEVLDTYDKVLENIKKVYQEYEDMDKIDIVKLFEDTGFDFTDFLSGDANLETTLTSLATTAYQTVRKTFSSLSDNDPIIIDLFNKKQGLRGEAFGWEDALHDINTLKPLLEKASNDVVFTMEELDAYIKEYDLSADLLKVDGGYKIDKDAVESLLNKAKEEYNTALALFRTYLREQGFGEEAIDSFFGLLNLYYETIDSSSSSSSSSNDFEQQIDWAAQSISNLEEKVSDLENVLDNTKGWEAQLEAIQDVIEAQEDLQKGYAQARDLYLSEYNNALNSGILAELGLSNSFKKKIESDGFFNIEDFIDENVSKNVDKGTQEQIYDAVQEAMDWYDKYIDADNNYIEIGFQIDENKLEQLNIEADHLSAVREKLETALDGTITDSDKLDLLSKLSTALENDYNKQIEIAQAEKNTEEAEKLQLELKQELYDLDQQRLELSREITESENEQLEVERTRIENQIDLNGGKGTAEQYQSLIRNENELLAKRTAEYEDEVSLLQKIGEEVGINSTEYREQLKVVNECADGIAECEKNTKEWEIALLSLPLDEIEDKINELNKKLDDVNDKQSEMDDVIAGAQAYIQDEIDGYEELKQNIQDQIDALQESNDERERALNLQKAQYELERAMSQRTVKLYSGKEKGFIYTQNQDEVRDAQENLSNLEFENTIYQLEKQINYYDDIIDDLQEIKDAWGNIASEAEDYLNIQKAIAAIGENGIWDYEQIDKYTASYKTLVVTAGELEEAINSWEDFKAGLEEIVEKYEYGAYSSLTEAKGIMRDYAHDYLYGLEEYQVLIDGMVDPEKTEEKVNNAVYQIITKYFDGFEEIENGSAETGETTAENLTEPIENAIDTIEENLDQFQDDVEKLNTTLEQDSQEAMKEVEENAASSYAAMTESLRKELSAQRQELDSYKQDLLNLQNSITSVFQQMFNTISNNLSNSLEVFSNSVYSACSDLESRLSEISDQIQDMPSVEIASTINSVSSTVLGITGGSDRSTVSFERLATYHTGLDNGYVGEVHSDNKRLKILQMAGEGLLKPDETFAKLQNNELVLTKQQQSNIAKALMNTPYNTALFNTSDLGAIASSSKETSVNFGDVNINCPGITSQQVAKQVGVEMQRVIKELPLNTLQYSNRR